MDEQKLPIEEEHYTPRPRWQVVLAWVGVAIMAISIILYYIQIMFPTAL